MDECGNVTRQSNARMVKWSDGSMSLHLGNEIFDVYKQTLQGDHNHMFIRQGTGLQGQAVFRTKLTFRPHSTESFTHKKMTMSLADRSQKTSGIKILTQVGHNPDVDRHFNLKKEEEKLRQAMRQKTTQTKPKRSRDAAANSGSAYREDGDHESDDEGAISIAAIKNKYKGGAAASAPKQGKRLIPLSTRFRLNKFFVCFQVLPFTRRTMMTPISTHDEARKPTKARHSERWPIPMTNRALVRITVAMTRPTMMPKKTKRYHLEFPFLLYSPKRTNLYSTSALTAKTQ